MKYNSPLSLLLTRLGLTLSQFLNYYVLIKKGGGTGPLKPWQPGLIFRPIGLN